MQRIERYGVIALVLLLVTIAAVSFWDDGGAQETGKAKRESVASQQRKAALQSGKKAKNVRIGNQELPVTAPKQNKAQNQKSTQPQQPGRSWSSQVNVPRKTTPKKTFETVPATVATGETERFEGSNGGSETQQAQAPTTMDRNGGRQPETNKRGAEQGTQAQLNDPGERAAREERLQPTTRPEKVAKSGTYTVRAGDTLSQIAERELGTSRRWGEIQALNGGIDPSAIYVGMVLTLPDGAGNSLRAVETANSMEIPPSSPGGSYYTVRTGDSLSQIAQDHLGGASKWKDIVALNPGLNPNVLIVGKRLRLPSGSGYSAGSTLQASVTPTRSRKKNRVR